MYYNNIHVIWYLVAIILGGIVGQIVEYCSDRFIRQEKILSKKNIIKYLKVFMPNYVLIFTISVLYVIILNIFGLKNYIELLKFMLLIPMLLIVFIVDLKEKIIPDRLNLTLFEIGLIFTFVSGMKNINVASDLLLGMLVGGGIFLLITLIGEAISGKEAMGYGDVKFMLALGLYFGVNKILMISILSFLIGAIVSIILLIIKKNKLNGYVAFGPFITISTTIVMLFPFNMLFDILIKIFSLGLS